jgi:hypothetical protein
MKSSRFKKGQNVIEYAMLITIVLVSLTAMSICIMRLVNVGSLRT